MTSSSNQPQFQTIYTDMDQEPRATVNNRWAQGLTEEGARDLFNRYAAGNQNSRQQIDQGRSRGVESQKRYVSEVSQISVANDAFKKTKFNQMETLKELRQEYQILRGMQLQDEFLKHSHAKKQDSSEYDSRRGSESVSSSSKHTDKRKRASAHSNQILTLEKRQLELVIGNSMRKIEELLNNESEYKRTIHELQLQIDSLNSEDKLESITKTMKKNEKELEDKIEGLKREIQRLRQINKQLEDRNSYLEEQLLRQTQESKRTRDEKRSLEDQIRLEKDKYLNLEIELKRTKMQSEILQKDKNNQINRLKGLLEIQPIDQSSGSEVKRLENQLQAFRRRYEMLSSEFDKYKREVLQRSDAQNDHRNNDQQVKLIETLLSYVKEESNKQNRASIDLISSMISKIDQRGDRKDQPREDNKLIEELLNLRKEVSSLKRQREDDRQSRIMNLTESMADYQAKIRHLENEIADGSISKENLLKQYENIRSSYEYTKEQYEILGKQNQRLKARLNEIQSQPAQTTFNPQYEETIRQLSRQLDEALFRVDQAKKEIELNVNIVRTQCQAKSRLLVEQIARLEGEKEVLRGEITKMKAYYDGKIQEKNRLLQKTTLELTSLCESKEQALVTFKTAKQAEFKDLIRKLESMSEVNQRYLRQSTQFANLQRELHELRFSLKRMKGLNDGVDHLWNIKETEYHNINNIFAEMKAN